MSGHVEGQTEAKPRFPEPVTFSSGAKFPHKELGLKFIYKKQRQTKKLTMIMQIRGIFLFLLS
jgi:hypothetical protein